MIFSWKVRLHKLILNDKHSEKLIFHRITMKKLGLCLLFCFLGLFSVFAQKIYVTDTPSLAQIKVFIVPVPDMADLVVYKASTPSYMGVNQNKGIWYFVPVPDMAEKVIYYVKTPDLANLKVYFADVPSLAGWQNQSKKQLMK